MNELMHEDIWSQPDALRTGIQDLRHQAASVKADRVRRIVLTGSGDSLIAPLAVEALYRREQQNEVRAIPALDAARYLAWSDTDLVVVVSVSGEVSRAIEVARRAAAAGAATVAITAAAESTLAKASEYRLCIPPPIDRSIPHSRDYTVTLAALAVLLERLVGSTLRELDRWPDLVASFLQQLFDTSDWAPPTVGRTWFLGAGPDRATAMYGALKFWEAAGLQAWWDDLEEFAHGSQLMAAPGDRAILIAAGGGFFRAVEMLPGLKRMGLSTLLLSADAVDTSETLSLPTLGAVEWHPFSACLPMQHLAYVDATRRELDVSIPLHGQAHSLAFDAVHVEWTKRSRIIDAVTSKRYDEK